MPHLATLCLFLAQPLLVLLLAHFQNSRENCTRCSEKFVKIGPEQFCKRGFQSSCSFSPSPLSIKRAGIWQQM
uniref:Putative secreted protein n=1 Tax=Anopheles darlingi TaxID=43151 RepID=A0A2M4D6X8_ANODA